MPDARISELPAASAPADTDLTALVQTSGSSLITNKASLAQIRAAVLDGRGAHVRDFGAKGDGTTDDAPAIQSAINALASRNGGVLYFDAKTYRLASAISVTGTAVRLQGQGFVEGSTPGNGTWLKVDATGFTPLTFTGNTAKGGGIADIAFYQVHPTASSSAWGPTNYDYLIRIQDCFGGVDLSNIFLCGINKGIYCANSGRLNIARLRGQVFTTGIEVDDAFDTVRIRDVHFWPFATANNFVMAYAQANGDAMLFRRVDGLFADQVFAFGLRSMFRFSGGLNGITSKFYIGQGYADFVQYGVLVEGAGTTGQIDSLTTQHLTWNSTASLTASNGIRLAAPNCRVQIGNLRIDQPQDNPVLVEQFNNRLDIFALRCATFNTRGNGATALQLADSGSNAANSVYLGSPPLLDGTTTGPLQNSSNGIVTMGAPAGAAAKPGLSVGSANAGLFQPSSTTLAAAAGGVEVLRATATGGITLGAAPNSHALEVATPAGTVNRLLLTGAATGSGVSIAAQGSDANVPLLLADKGSGSIQARSNGGLALKLDATGANPVNFVGIRAGTGSTAALVYGAGSATNADLQLGAQGSGLVRAVTPPTADNSSAVATTAWVQLQGYGTGGGGAVLSVAGRTGAVTLSVADISGAAPLASPALTGTPTAPTATAGTTTTQLATTAFVQGQGFITSAGAPVQSVAGRNGAVTLAVADVSGALAASTAASTYLALAGGTLTAALLANNGGSGNVARVAGAATGGYVALGIDSSSADANPPALLLQTKGTAAILAGQAPDSTATGGNARGGNAVDWQTSRTTAAQVASGSQATIGGGLNNTSSGTASTVAGGSSNTASAGNSVVAGGNSNNASGTGSFAAGVSNTANGSFSSIAGGTQGSAHGLYGAQVFASGQLAAQGDAQAGQYVLRGRAASGAAVRLTADAAAAGSANVANLPLNTAWSGDLMVTARDTASGNCCRWKISLGLGVQGTAATTIYVEGAVEFANIIGTVAATGNLARSADTTNRGINLTFTPANSNTWDVVAELRTAEVQ